LLDDDNLRHRLGGQAARWAGRFGWPVVADQILGVYDQVQSGVEQSVRVSSG